MDAAAWEQDRPTARLPQSGRPRGASSLRSVTALLAHAAPISYKFPLPIWLYVLAGGAAVLLSAPAAGLAVRTAEPEDRLGPDLYPWARRLRLGALVTGVGVIVIAIAFAGGLFSTTAQ